MNKFLSTYKVITPEMGRINDLIIEIKGRCKGSLISCNSAVSNGENIGIRSICPHCDDNYIADEGYTGNFVTCARRSAGTQQSYETRVTQESCWTEIANLAEEFKRAYNNEYNITREDIDE